MNDAASRTDKEGLINLCALVKTCLIAETVREWTTKKHDIMLQKMLNLQLRYSIE